MDIISRRTLLRAAAGGLTATGGMLMSGCSGLSAPNAGTKKVLQAWVFSGGRYRWHLKVWDLYKKLKNPDFEIEWLLLPFRQMHDMVLITAQAGSGGPDIADIEISQFSRYIKGKVIFTDQTAKLQEAGVLDSFYKPSSTDPWSWQGKVYGLGNQLNTCYLAYRSDLLEKYGIKTPIETWEDFAEAGRRYHRDSGQYLIDFPYNDWTSWWMMVLQQKSGFFGPDGHEPLLQSPESLKVLTYQQQAIKEGWAILRPAGQSYFTAISTDSIATVIGAPWNFGNVETNSSDTEGKWQAQPLPRWEPGGSQTATWGGTGTTILKTSPFINEAWDFILFENTAADALHYDFEARTVWPAYRPALEDPRFAAPLEFFANQRVGNLIHELSPDINQWYNSPFWVETTDAFVRSGVTPCLLQGVAPEVAAASAQNEARRIIEFESA